jgi:hypothetical protein
MSLLVATLSVVPTGCDPGPAVNAIGVSMEKGATAPVIHWVACPDEVIADVRLEVGKRESEGDEDERVLWEIENRGGSQDSSDFPVGAEIDGFDTVQPLTGDPIPSSQGLVAAVKTDQVEAAIPFTIDQLKTHQIWPYPGELFSPDEFNRRGHDVCPTR